MEEEKNWEKFVIKPGINKIVIIILQGMFVLLHSRGRNLDHFETHVGLVEGNCYRWFLLLLLDPIRQYLRTHGGLTPIVWLLLLCQWNRLSRF